MKEKFHQRVFALMLALMLAVGTVFAIPSDVNAAVKPTKITLSAKTLSVIVGKTAELKVSAVTPKTASNSVTFKSSNSKVATVNSQGVITGVKAGKTTITVKSKINTKVTAKCSVTVKAPAAQMIMISNALSNTVSVQNGKTLTLKPSLSPSGAVSNGYTYTSANKSVATVSAKGKITAKKAGKTTVTIKAKGTKIVKKITVIVPKTTVKSVSLNKTSDTLAVGGMVTLKATVSPTKATTKLVSWSSNKTSVATVDSNGKVKAIAAGTATITVATLDGNKKATCKIVVKQPVTSLMIDKATLSLQVGSKASLVATVLPENATDKTVTWTSSDTSVAAVSKGEVTAVKAGTATITASASGKVATCTVIVSEQEAEGPVESDIYVEPIANISDDFIRGMDASEVLALENSGVTFYNFEGEEQDVFETLADAGVDYIRLRVWNNPYDENGNGYGGGNNNVATAIELGKRATKYGMKVCIDFHYSDFWADPNRQLAPKAWKDMTGEQKSTAVYDFTVDSLTQILNAGVDVGMVQVGNEINIGMSGETDVPTVMNLLNSGSKAVREMATKYAKDIKVVLHYTHIANNSEVYTLASNLNKYNVDYDIFGMSYYPMWDGTNQNMQNVAKTIMDTYGKKVIIAETSYCYTSEDGDGFGNSFVGKTGLVNGYGATVQSQATIVRDICAAANDVGVSGVFYWGGTWVPVGSATEDNTAIWEKYGSGWASSYASAYDPVNVGEYYGGDAWDNQAMFDFTGHPLASLNVFKYLKNGSTTSVAVDYVPDITVSCNAGDTLVLPDKVDAVYNNRAENKQCAVTWNQTELAAINTGIGGTYQVTGTVEGGVKVTCQVEVKATNLVQNPSFEDADTSMWTVSYTGSTNPTDYLNKAADAHSGDIAFHFYSGTSDMDFSVEQNFTNLEVGTYKLSAYSQGGSISSDAVMELYAVTNEGESTAPFALTSYIDWKNPTISEIKVTDGTLKIGVRIKCGVGGWGTVDDFSLIKISD